MVDGLSTMISRPAVDVGESSIMAMADSDLLAVHIDRKPTMEPLAARQSAVSLIAQDRLPDPGSLHVEEATVTHSVVLQNKDALLNSSPVSSSVAEPPFESSVSPPAAQDITNIPVLQMIHNATTKHHTAPDQQIDHKLSTSFPKDGSSTVNCETETLSTDQSLHPQPSPSLLPDPMLICSPTNSSEDNFEDCQGSPECREHSFSGALAPCQILAMGNVAIPEVECRRSMDKDSVSPTALPFSRLPDEIIEQILQVIGPNGFASMVMLNSKWRRISCQSHLYALQLSRCPSFTACHAGVGNKKLPELRRLFAHEVKRNLFEAYLRPHQTVIKIASNSISSSSSPGGEIMQFSSSPRGHHLLAYNSSRIYVLDVRLPSLEVKRELKILRRPVSNWINDDGTLLAVLSNEMQVDIYSLEQVPVRRTQSIILDHSPRTIALSPCGRVLAAAYEGGIEVTSLDPAALPTQRRAVKCDAVDSLAFSLDGTQLLGTSTSLNKPNTVILTAPFLDPDRVVGDDDLVSLWTTSILFPSTSRDCSHAVLLQHSAHEEAGWTFTYDCSFEMFRAVRIDDLRNGTTYFTGPVPTSHAQLVPSSLPATSQHSELVAAGFLGKDVWLYAVPEDLDAVADLVASSMVVGGAVGRPGAGAIPAAWALGALPSQRRTSPQCHRSHAPRRMGLVGGMAPQWQARCERVRNTFIGGVKVAELEGVSTVKWVAGFGSRSSQERLIIAARGVQPVVDEADIDFVDGGRITLLDFDYGIVDGLRTEMTIEVGTEEAEVLEEEQRDLETDVAIIRRRTVAQHREAAISEQSALLQSATAAMRDPTCSLQRPAVGQSRNDNDDNHLRPRRPGVSLRALTASAAVLSGRQPGFLIADVQEEQEGEDEEGLVTPTDEQDELDHPYSHGNPRSGTTLRRAATAAAANRSRQPERPMANVEYRRADGRVEPPHESDADNWVPPPPPYQKEDPGDLPVFLRHTILSSRLAAPPVPSIPVSGALLSPAVATTAMPLPASAAAAATTPSVSASPAEPLPPPDSSQEPAATLTLEQSLEDDHAQALPQVHGEGRLSSLQSPSTLQAFAILSPFLPPLLTAPAVAIVPVIQLSRPGSVPLRPGTSAGDRLGQPVASYSVESYASGIAPDVSPPDSPYFPLRQSLHDDELRSMAISPNSDIGTVFSPPAILPILRPLLPPPPPLPLLESRGLAASPDMTSSASSDLSAVLPLILGLPASHTLNHANTSIGFVGNAATDAETPFAALPPLPLHLSTAHSWPRAPQKTSSVSSSHGLSSFAPAPIFPSVHDLNSGAFPPLPRPEQLASLQLRQDNGHLPSRRLSRAYTPLRVSIPRPPSSQFAATTATSGRTAPTAVINKNGIDAPLALRHSAATALNSQPVPDTPLIISTPVGLTGAFDDADTMTRSLAMAPEPLIWAPMPLRANPVVGGLRPTVERLETIYSVSSEYVDTSAYSAAPATSPSVARHRSNFPFFDSARPSTSSGIPASVATTLAPSRSSRTRLTDFLARRQSRAEFGTERRSHRHDTNDRLLIPPLAPRPALLAQPQRPVSGPGLIFVSSGYVSDLAADPPPQSQASARQGRDKSPKCAVM